MGLIFPENWNVYHIGPKTHKTFGAIVEWTEFTFKMFEFKKVIG